MLSTRGLTESFFIERSFTSYASPRFSRVVNKSLIESSATFVVVLHSLTWTDSTLRAKVKFCRIRNASPRLATGLVSTFRFSISCRKLYDYCFDSAASFAKTAMSFSSDLLDFEQIFQFSCTRPRTRCQRKTDIPLLFWDQIHKFFTPKRQMPASVFVTLFQVAPADVKTTGSNDTAQNFRPASLPDQRTAHSPWREQSQTFLLKYVLYLLEKSFLTHSC